MAKFTQAAKVGLFVIASAGMIAIVVRTVSKETGNGKGYVVHAILKDATGLAPRSRVAIAGIPIGTLKDITLENGEARVNIQVNGDVPLYTNATIGKKSASLLGESVLVVTPGTADQPKLHDGDEIHLVIEAASTDQILQDVARIADRVKAVAEQLANAVGSEQGGKNMSAILQNLSDATDAMNRTVRENREAIHETLIHLDNITANGEPQMAKILENVRQITQDVKDLVASNQNGQPNNIKDTIDHLDKSSRSLEDALKHIDNTTTRIDEGKGTIGRLTKDETLINEVQDVAEGVNDYVGGITRLKTIVGLRTDYNFLANTIKSYVEVRLQPREDKYYVIELINDPRGYTSFTQQSVDTTNPTQPAHYQTITTTTSDAFLFSLQFAKRIGPFTGRFGVKESTGGVGLDINLLHDRFEVVNDLFGFGVNLEPRYRVFIGYEFINKLWLLGGVDYVFDQTQRDYFLGLQLRFTDEDLKTILPFAGGAISGASSSH
ncbi:MAG: MlaD family protein [Polyangiaceae bacterium]|jgi:phospholipid/cholesterol/gamma-HCH transport system substrate-binding protein